MKSIPDFSFVESIVHIGRRDTIDVLQLKRKGNYGGFHSTVPNHFDGTKFFLYKGNFTSYVVEK